MTTDLIDRADIQYTPRARYREPKQRLRVLHVVSQMRRAGIETWLMNVIRRVDRSRFQMDFLVHRNQPGEYDEEIRSLGCRILQAPPIRDIWNYNGRLRKVLLDVPPYDVMHSHVDSMSGYPLKCADQIGIPVRIAHSHNNYTSAAAQMRMSLRLVARHGRRMLLRRANYFLAASDDAGETLFGPERDTNWRVLFCGIDLAAFASIQQDRRIRSEFGIPEGASIIGHVGRFAAQKNHRKMLAIADVLRRRGVEFRFVFVGDGPLRADVESEIDRLQLRDTVLCIGSRSDIPQLLTSVFDVFALPSLFEGLGLVLIEAQAAGCPSVVSDVVPKEADVVPGLVARLPLEAAAEQWADALLVEAAAARNRQQSKAAMTTVSESPFDIDYCIRELMDLYLRAYAQSESRLMAV